ncbi:MAG TPA: tetratricopeptide repeat protein [Polyangia bacterium]
MFFDRFREALSRLPDGLVRPGPPATATALAAVEAALARPLPQELRSFLQSFDGVDLFHEAVIIAGADAGSLRTLSELNPEPGRSELVFAETVAGDRFALRADGVVLRLRGGGDTDDAEVGENERWLAGSDFTRWLDALVAHERVLYGPDGEFSPDAFEPDGAEILPLVALRQTERALKIDPGAAELHHERAIALRRLGRDADAREAYQRAAQLDPENPWTWFDLGRAALADGVAGARDALDAFERAAAIERGQTAARLWIWAARAAQLLAAPEKIAACRKEALALLPELAGALRRARDAAAGSEDPDELSEAEALLEALEGPIATGRARLTVLTELSPSAPRTPRPASGAPEQKRPTRPPRAGAAAHLRPRPRPRPRPKAPQARR